MPNFSSIELGSGVGLSGIVAARYAEKVWLTDYLDSVVDNLTYNIHINCNLDDESDDDYEGLTEEEKALKKQERRKYAEKVKNASAGYLNWDQVDDINPGTKHNIPQADIIIGSELTYSPKSVDGLVRTVLRYLKPEGVFYELLSTDRDGVPLFLERIKEAGFETVVHNIPDQYLGNYSTNQRPESYKFYTFRVCTIACVNGCTIAHCHLQRSATIYPDCK